jgi:hypothetical protein
MSVKEDMSEMRKAEQIRLLEKQWATTFTVKEGTVVGVMRFGALREIHMAYKGYELDKKGWVVESKGAGAGQGRLGALHTKVPGRDKLLAYNFTWSELKLTAEGKHAIVTRQKVINYSFVKPTDYAIEVKDAETKTTGKNQERIPVTILANVLIRVVNPRKAWYESPSNWFEYAGTRLKTMIKDWVATKTINEVFSFREQEKEDATVKIWNEFKKNRIIRDLRNKRGIQVEPYGIDFIDVSTLEEYQKVLASGKIAEITALADRKSKTIRAETQVMVERREKKAETIELKHVTDRAKQLKDDVGLSPEDAVEVVQTERGKVVKQIIEYKGLKGAGGLPLISIGGEGILRGKGEEKRDTDSSREGRKSEEKDARPTITSEEDYPKHFKRYKKQ